MPTYEYICSCGHTFEYFLSIKAEHIKHCRECNKEVRPEIGTGSAIIFKGSGFYQTDYKNKGKDGKKNERREEERREKNESKVIKE